jgi:hypothetical protein
MTTTTSRTGRPATPRSSKPAGVAAEKKQMLGIYVDD